MQKVCQGPCGLPKDFRAFKFTASDPWGGAWCGTCRRSWWANNDWSKVCPGCHQDKNKTEYYAKSETVDGRQTRCKACMIEDSTTPPSRSSQPERAVEKIMHIWPAERRERFLTLLFQELKARRVRDASAVGIGSNGAAV